MTEVIAPVKIEPIGAVLPAVKQDPPAPHLPTAPKEPVVVKGTDNGEDSVRSKLLDKLDRHLDQDEEDKKTMDRLKNPFVRWTVGSLIALLFGVFIVYFLAFILKIPLPESKVLEHLMNIILEIIKVLVPPT